MLTFRLAREEDRTQLEDLWAYCFEPRENPFFQWYFKDCCQVNNVLLGWDGERLVCDTHLNPYTIRVRGKEMPSSYIVGLATHPAARSRGVGKQLLTAALEEMRRRGHWLNLLMPSKASFYQPYGWELYCHQWKESVDMTGLKDMGVKGEQYAYIRDSKDWPWLAAVYEQYTAGLSGCTVRSEADWKRLLAGVFAEGGHCAAVFEHGRPTGYILYSLGSPTIVCSEFVYTTRKAKQSLLYYLYNHRSQGERVQWNEGLQDQTYRLYGDGKQGHETMPFMAGRVVDAEHALAAVAYEADGSCMVALEDPLAEWNCGTFRLTAAGGAGIAERTEDTPQIRMDIGALALLLFGAMTAKELVYCGRADGEEEAVSWLTRALPKKDTYVNEWY